MIWLLGKGNRRCREVAAVVVWWFPWRREGYGLDREWFNGWRNNGLEGGGLKKMRGLQRWFQLGSGERKDMRWIKNGGRGKERWID